MKALQSESEQARMQFAIFSSNILSGNTNNQNKIHCSARASKQHHFLFIKVTMEFPQKIKKTIYNDNNVYSVYIYD